jgi:hypothetical protein
MIENWNRDCFCVSLDPAALRAALNAQSDGLAALIESRFPNLFAALPVFVSRRHIDAMAEIVAAVEETVALPGYREAALAHAREIARHDLGARGAFMGYDFHLGTDGPRLIEINTNAGGALLNAVLGNAQRTRRGCAPGGHGRQPSRSCCEALRARSSYPGPAPLAFGASGAGFSSSRRAATPARRRTAATS